MLDIYFFLFVAFLAPLADLWLYPRLQRASAAGTPGVRSRYYLLGAGFLWLLAGSVIALANHRHLPWSALRLSIPSLLRVAIGAAFVIAYASLALYQRRALVANPERLRRVMKKHATESALVPHTRPERRVFSFLAISAGVCEEVVYRGFMLWFAAMWIGLWPALLVSSIVFGFAHIYLGLKHVLRTAIAGAVFALIAVAAGSLWPVILIHTMVDLIGGDLGFRALEASS